MLVDSHAHLNFQAFEADRQQVIARCLKQDMKVINVGSQSLTSQMAVKIAGQYPDMYAAVGIHPIHVGQYEYDPHESQAHEQIEQLTTEQMFEQISQLAKQAKVVAIGETGLDYYRLKGEKEATQQLQRDWFVQHLDLAQSLKLPVILHCRTEEGYRDMYELIRRRSLTGVVHCFGSDAVMAQKFVDLGYYIGLTGIVTFRKNAEELQRVAIDMPLDRILIETDCPYLTPEPHRGERNEPIYVKYIAGKIAQLKGLSVEQVAQATSDNAIELFNLS